MQRCCTATAAESFPCTCFVCCAGELPSLKARAIPAFADGDDQARPGARALARPQRTASAAPYTDNLDAFGHQPTPSPRNSTACASPAASQAYSRYLRMLGVTACPTAHRPPPTAHRPPPTADRPPPTADRRAAPAAARPPGAAPASRAVAPRPPPRPPRHPAPSSRSRAVPCSRRPVRRAPAPRPSTAPSAARAPARPLVRRRWRPLCVPPPGRVGVSRSDVTVSGMWLWPGGDVWFWGCRGGGRDSVTPRPARPGPGLDALALPRLDRPGGRGSGRLRAVLVARVGRVRRRQLVLAARAVRWVACSSWRRWCRPRRGGGRWPVSAVRGPVPVGARPAAVRPVHRPRPRPRRSARRPAHDGSTNDLMDVSVCLYDTAQHSRTAYAAWRGGGMEGWESRQGAGPRQAGGRGVRARDQPRLQRRREDSLSAFGRSGNVNIRVKIDGTAGDSTIAQDILAATLKRLQQVQERHRGRAGQVVDGPRLPGATGRPTPRSTAGV